jgi:membrane protein DedA with SNARE-associated domain
VILGHPEWLLFVWVLGNQGGLPVPVVPALLGAGALAGSGHLSLGVLVVLAVGASLVADLAWYGLGQWRGARALRMLARLSPSADILVHRARHVFGAHGGAFQLGARFLPELNAISAGLAGAANSSIVRFAFYGLASAVMWAGGWIGLGYFLSNRVTETAARLGVRLIIFFLAPFALYLLFDRARRHRVIHLFRRARMNPDDLSVVLEKGDRMAMPVSHQSSVESVRCAVRIDPRISREVPCPQRNPQGAPVAPGCPVRPGGGSGLRSPAEIREQTVTSLFSTKT